MLVEATYFDGKSAKAHLVTLTMAPEQLSFELEGEQIVWEERHMHLLEKNDKQLRFNNKKFPDAILVIDREFEHFILHHFQDLLGGGRTRKNFIKLLIGLVVLAVSVFLVLFVGVPAASGFLAKNTSYEWEEQLGENVQLQLEFISDECPSSSSAIEVLQPVVDKMALEGEVGFNISISIIDWEMANAFAFPGGNVAITEGLLAALEDDPEALLAVMAHELGHVKSRDAMQAFYRNLGLSFLLEAITGGSGLAQQAILVGGQVAQMSHSRKQEARADETAFAIMQSVDMNPEALARAFELMFEYEGVELEEASEAESESAAFNVMSWLETHPETEQRVAKARALDTGKSNTFFTPEEWEAVTGACRINVDEDDVEEVGAE